MVKLRQRAKAGQLSYDEYRSKAVETLYGATNQGSRLNGQKGSIFSEHAANEFLVSKYKLNGVGAVGANASQSIANRNSLVDTQIAERLGTWRETMRSDMKLRRMTGPQGEIRARDIDQYIRTVGGGSLNQSFAGMNAAQRNQASGEARELMRSVLGGNDLKKEAKSMRLALVSQFDTYFENKAQMMRRNAAASDSPFGDGMTGLARLPALNSANCLARYSGCCCANLGLEGMAELPSAPWHAAQTPNLDLPSEARKESLGLLERLST
jgi:hypothetical protein